MLRIPFTLALVLLGSGVAGQDPVTALARLRAGNDAFVRGELLALREDDGWRRTLAAGARPWAVVVSCADSRSAPEVLFQTSPGDLVVVRTTGAVCDPETLAAIEHAAAQLGVRLCVFVTHSDCSAVAADLAGGAGSPTLRRHLERLERARLTAQHDGWRGDELAAASEREAAQLAIEHALAQSRLLRERVRSGELLLRGARHDLASGEVEWLPYRGHEPEPEDGPPPHRGQQVLGLPPALAVELLRAGHARAASGARQRPDLSAQTRARLAQGPRAHAVVLTDTDPRLVPELLFDAGPGELCVVRVPGAGASDGALASIEQAVDEGGAGAVVVLVSDAMAPLQALAHGGTAPTPAMQRVFDHLAPACAQARGEGLHGELLLARARDLHAWSTVAALRARSELLRDLERRGRVVLLPAKVALATGEVTWLPAEPVAAGAPIEARAPDPAAAPHAEETQSFPDASLPPAPVTESAAAAPPVEAPAKAARSPLFAAMLAAFLFAGTLLASLTILYRLRARTG